MDAEGIGATTLFQFSTPCSIGICGPTLSGKTTLLLNILKNSQTMFNQPPHRIIYAYGIYQPAFDNLEKDIPNLTLHEGIPNEEMIRGLDSSKHNLLILDDLMEECAKSKHMSIMATRGVHHMNITVCFILQNIYYKSSIMRTISLNLSYFILMKTNKDLQQIHCLSRQMFPSTPMRLVEAFEDATKIPRGYLVINNLPDADEDTRLATGILPNQMLTLYIKK